MTEQKEYAVVNYPTNHVPMIQNPNEELLTVEQAFVELLNKVDKLLKVMTDK